VLVHVGQQCVCDAVLDVVEVCQTEHFEASCERSDEVILMTSSEYGRMRVSRCVQSDYGYIGCSADVLGVVDAACSGRRRCNVGVPSAALERAAAVACPGDLKLYLAASYRCLPGNIAPSTFIGILYNNYYGPRMRLVIRSVASVCVCLSVCHIRVLTFKSLDQETSCWQQQNGIYQRN